MARAQAVGIAPGEEFLASIVSIFTEFEHKGFTTNKDRKHFARQICNFLDNCRTTTGATARANFSFTLPNGNSISSSIGLPPRGLTLTKACRTRLERSQSVDGFVGELKAQIKKTVHMVNATMKREASASPEPFAARRAKQRKTERFPRKRTTKRQILDESEDDEETKETKEGVNESDSLIVHLKVPKAVLVAASNQSSAADGEEATGIEETQVAQSVEHGQASALGNGVVLPGNELPTPPASSPDAPAEDTAMCNSDASAPDAAEVAFREARATLRHDMEILINNIMSSGALNLQDRDALLQHLNTDLHAPRVHMATSCYAAVPLRRLMGLELHCVERIACIDPANWAFYSAQLKDLCCSPAYAQMDYHQRLTKVVDFVYMPEELFVAAKSDWERLQDVAVLCSLIAEITGPETEVVPDEIKNQWIAAKKEDIAFLNRLMGAKSRIEAFRLGKD